MKDIFLQLNEALARLKEASASKYSEVTTKLTTINSTEAKLNCVNEAIAQAVKESDPLGLTNIDEALSDPSVAVLFGRDPRQATPIKETAPVVKKHNGSAENFVEGSPFNEGRSAANTETDNTPHDMFAKADAVMVESMTHPMTKEPLTEAEKATVRGGQPVGYASLTEKQRKDYDFARLIGLNESDALKVASI